MPGPSEFKTLRDELARAVGQSKKLGREFESFREEASRIIAGQRATIADLRAEVATLKKVNGYHENPHAPPSKNSLREQKRRADAKRNAGPAKSPGRKDGHMGVSHSYKSAKTRHHTRERCANCGSKNIRITRTMQKQVHDIPKIAVTTTTDISHEYSCGDCSSGFNSTPGWIVPGTSLGPNLMAMSGLLWDHANSIDGMAEIVNSLSGSSFCGATIEHAMDAATDAKLKPVADEIYKSHGSSGCIMMDETTYSMKGKTVWPWACVSQNGTTILPEVSRGMIVLEMHFSHLFGKPITVDGHAAYNLFKTRQRCWSHILREAEYAADDPLTRLLYERLKLLYCEAKEMQGAGAPDAQIESLVDRTLSIAEEYRTAGAGFATKLGNAAEDLYTFVRYPGMEPTNNRSERALRRAVIHRKIRQKFASAEGMRRFGIRMSCFMTWRMQGLSVYDKLLGALGAA